MSAQPASVTSASGGVRRKPAAGPAAAVPPVAPQPKTPAATTPPPPKQVTIAREDVVRVSDRAYEPSDLHELLFEIKRIISGVLRVKAPEKFQKAWVERTPKPLQPSTRAFIEETWVFMSADIQAARIEEEANSPAISNADYDKNLRELERFEQARDESAARLKASRTAVLSAYHIHHELAFDAEMAYLSSLFATSSTSTSRAIKEAVAAPGTPEAEVAAADPQPMEVPLVRTTKEIDREAGKAVQSLFRKAGAPNANLGQQEVGPSREKITYGSAVKLLTAMGVNDRAVFIDIGCAHGTVVFAAVLMFGAARGMGVDLAKDPIIWASNRRKEQTPEVASRLFFREADITKNWFEEFDQATHIYSFTKDFPPEALYAIAERLHANRKRWRMFAGGKSLKDMTDSVAEWAEANPKTTRAVVVQFMRNSVVERAEKVRVNLQISSQSLTIWLCDNTSQ